MEIDVLTELGNRYGFEKYLEDLKTNKKDLTVIVADMNNLKKINDTFGHAYGDKALIDASNFLKSNFENADIFRVGGDEFFIFADKDINTKEIEKLNAVPINIKDISSDIEVSFAIGYEKYEISSGKTIEEVINKADENMYKAKRKYKNLNEEYTFREVNIYE